MKWPKRTKNSRALLRRPKLMAGQDELSFRRSRTLTGSRSHAVRAARVGRAVLQSDRLKKQILRRRRRLILAGLIGLLVIISGLYYLVSQYSTSVRTLTFEPSIGLSQQPPAELYQKAILSYLQVQPAQRFRFALDSHRLTSAVRRQHPEIASVEATGGGMGYSDFTLTFRTPIVSWKLADKQYFVDESGETFEKNYGPSPSVNVVDRSGATLSRGDIVASRGFLKFLGRLVAIANTSGLGQVTEASLPPNTTREIDITLAGRGYSIKTHTDRDPAQEVEDMQRVIGYLEQRKVTPAYIDVRVAGRAYYQ